MTERAKSALIAYFDYQKNKVGNGYSSKSIVAKMMNGDIGGSRRGGGTLKGVEMTDLGFLQVMSRVEVALNDLKSKQPRSWEYLHLRYGKSMSKSDISKEMGCHLNSCTNYHKKGISFIDAYM